MSLENGVYYIQNRKQYIGNSGEEPPNAQRVIVLPDGVQAPKWFVQKLGDDVYIIRVEEPDGSNGLAVRIDDKVFVRPEKPEPDAWRIIPDERGGKDSYIIVTAEDLTKGWVAPEEPEDQIVCQTLKVGRSFPPFYPPNETFQFSPADN
ncbi:serine protease inhibitor [Moniliophthora roreri MCA 2997]|uniref:Serine protease inhibitor n=1 Tax=Moniliophthora roreri (strain MCA 2997) TaxID=1381753 RepID=V2X3K5_MONRO|nr:serine protease inhibitor [Moniliophthora roreri MCA 2997]